MRAIVLFALAGWSGGGSLHYHFTDQDGRRFELRLAQPPPKVHFELAALPVQKRLLLHTVYETEDAQSNRGRYAMGYPIPEYVASSAVLAGGASLLGTIVADFVTHPSPNAR